MPEPAIIVEGLSKHYGDVAALDGLDFQIASGRITALLGGNGAGKTTTIAILLGLLLPSAGRGEELGEDMLRQRHRGVPRLNLS